MHPKDHLGPPNIYPTFILHPYPVFGIKRLFMVGVAQLVERLVVAQVVVGSSPITHPIQRKRPLPRYPSRNGLAVYTRP